MEIFPNEKWVFFNDDFDKELISSETEKITFGENFNKPLGYFGSGGILPKKLITLELSGKFNQSLDFLPDGLKILHFMKNSEFNRMITKLPKELEILRFGDLFNNQIIYLPPKLKILEFGNNFNQPIDPNFFPKNIFTISFGNLFNQNIDNIPDSVENIKLGDEFNKNIILPKNLKYIEFGKNFDKKFVLDILPNTIKKIKLSYSFPYLDEIIDKYGDKICVTKC